MSDINHKLCQYDGCNKYPTFAKKDAKQARFCNAYKKDDMVNVRSKRCEYDGGCDKLPIFADKGANRTMFCIAH
jgi:hypothetical protein